MNLPLDKKAHYTQAGVGHYGVFNGSRFRSEIAPRIADFIRSNLGNRKAPEKETSQLISLDAKRGSTPVRTPQA